MNYLLPRFLLLILGLYCLTWFGCGTSSLSTPQEVLIGELAESPPLLGFKRWTPASNGLDNWQEEGENQWKGLPGAPLLSEWSHADLALELEFKLDEDGVAELKLMNFYSIQLAGMDSPDQTKANTLYLPKELTKKAGIWQKLALTFQAASSSDPGKSAMLKELSLNGVSIMKDQVLVGQPEVEAAPVNILVQKGSLGLRNLYYRASEPGKGVENVEVISAVKPGLLNYRYFEGGPWKKLPDFTQLSPIKKGTTDFFRSKQLAQRKQQYALVYEGSIEIAQAGKYTLGVSSDDGVRVWWDGQVILEYDGVHAMQEKKKEVEMTPGEHSLKVEYFQGKGGAGLEMFYEGPGIPRTPLYTPSSSSDQNKEALPPATELASDEYPYVFRAFIAYPSQQRIKMPFRRTHGVAVGEAQGPHYTVDLSLGSLLTFWRGKFGQAGKLWIGRGESQQFVPLGNPLDRSGRPDFAFLENAQAAWPDTLDAYQSVLQFDRYELDEKGRPQFHYATSAGGEVSDLLLPEGEALLRQLSISQLDQPIWHQIAEGIEIENLGEGSYLVQGPGYRLDLLEGESVKLYLRSTEQGQELLAKLRGSNSSLKYQISW